MYTRLFVCLLVHSFVFLCVCLDQRSGPALRGHHDGHGAHALQRGLAHGEGVCVLTVAGSVGGCGRGGRPQAQRAVAARDDVRGRR